MSGEFYNGYAEYYHFHQEATGRDDIRFYTELSRSKGGRVLEIGCGTGRVSIELAKRGNTVTAIDLSDKMLNLFKEKNKSIAFDNDINIYKMDMTNFQLNEKFDWIIFPFRVFQALLTNQDRIDCLNCLKTHLKESGKVVIQMFNPNPIFFEKWSEMNHLDYEFFSKTFQTNIKRYIVGEKHNEQKQTINFHYKFVNGNDEFIDKMQLGYLYHNQAINLFKNNSKHIA